ncbi:FGGY carbohydrate kinase domain-containing protein-like isoform X1 [Homarus americanus]|uniref:FGGY carbohydrate kinase domain-containing protein-like isoform X1 n=2 Tax=Homarus americanus TaxID=6706 RepID=UPI001C44A95B|nr:FGGY carbohydrate kinase domain-containing protein-like isoform X1 [Homarus americanus]XP_042231553.1 FGGY carbohydrate kinase domain-containing protein-like isoform X1 [Homarus americanus]
MADIYYVGVDVGTSSVRAALVQQHGAILKIHTVPITVNNSNPDFYEQDSGEIWQAVCQSVKDVTCDIKDKTQIHGVGFDATCSLVVLDKDLDPVTVSPATGEDRFNIMMWMDHRAKEQADFINSHDHNVLKYVGGKVSLEMQTPKLLWLKSHMKSTWAKAAYFLDLPDFLTLKTTGQFSRSLCSMVCKWTYMCDGQTQGWDLNFFKAIGLEDLADNDWVKIGKEMVAPGTECGRVSAAAALEMGLCESTHVATSVIDAHAGGIALVAAEAKTKQDLIGRLALICGTSTCHMCVSVDPIFAHGVWGPYYSAMIPGYWCAEGGQSATGALVDHVIKTHPAVNKNPDKNVYEWLEGILDEMAEKQSLCSSTFLTKDLHLYPDFHGNRSPLADPSMVGMICGLTLDSSERSLALLYLATLQALAYGTRQIIEQLTTCGHNITSVLMCGGLSNSSLFIQTHADALGVPVLIPQEQQSVLLGASILAATASGDYPDLTAAAVAMGGKARTFEPRKDVKRYHDQKFAVFKKMQSDQKDYKHIMSGM